MGDGCCTLLKVNFNLVTQKIAASGYKPTSRKNNESISVDKWEKMSYSEKTEFYNTNPELAKKFMAKK